MLASLEGLEDCTALSTLLCSDNHLESAEDIAIITQCASLHTIDLRRNDLTDLNGVLSVLARLPQLKCVYLQGNPLVDDPTYRRNVLSTLSGLTYLDDLPIFDNERCSTNARALKTS